MDYEAVVIRRSHVCEREAFEPGLEGVAPHGGGNRLAGHGAGIQLEIVAPHGRRDQAGVAHGASRRRQGITRRVLRPACVPGGGAWAVMG